VKRVLVLSLAAAAVAATADAALAGGRARRTARRTTAVVAAAAVASRPTTLVAVAPVVAARPAAPRAAVSRLPDLIVADMVAEADVLTIVVQNVGQAPSPWAHLKMDLLRPGTAALVASQTLRIMPLAVGQTMRLRIASAPLDDVDARAVADSTHEVAELNEVNNDRQITIAPRPTPPPVLEVDAVWGQGADEVPPAAK